MTSRTNRSNDRLALPTHDEFMKGSIIISASDTKLPPENQQCGICLEPCMVLSNKAHIIPGVGAGQEIEDVDSQTVVFLKPCSECFFHQGCISRWFSGLCPERNTCPNDCTKLFLAKSLTKQQVTQRKIEEFLDNYEPEDFEPGSTFIFRVPGHDGLYCEEERYMLRQIVAEVSSEADLSTVSRNKNIMVDMLHLIIDRLRQRSGPLRNVFGDKGIPLLQYHVAYDLRLWLFQEEYRAVFSDASGRQLRDFHKTQADAIGHEHLGKLREEAQIRGFFEAGISEALVYQGVRVVPVDWKFVDYIIRACSALSGYITGGPVFNATFKMFKSVGMMNSWPARWLCFHWPSQEHRLARRQIREARMVLEQFTGRSAVRYRVRH